MTSSGHGEDLGAAAGRRRRVEVTILCVERVVVAISRAKPGMIIANAVPQEPRRYHPRQMRGHHVGDSTTTPGSSLMACGQVEAVKHVDFFRAVSGVLMYFEAAGLVKSRGAEPSNLAGVPDGQRRL